MVLSPILKCSVPQGSILGSLLLLRHVNDMKTSIISDCKLLLYADDSMILFSHQHLVVNLDHAVRSW